MNFEKRALERIITDEVQGVELALATGDAWPELNTDDMDRAMLNEMEMELGQ